MTWPQVIELPPAFYDDHVMRDLPAGTVVKRLQRSVRVRLTEAEAREILSDATYYADPATAAEMQLLGLAASARATVKRLAQVLDARPDLRFVFANPGEGYPLSIHVHAPDEQAARAAAGREINRAETWPLKVA